MTYKVNNNLLSQQVGPELLFFDADKALVHSLNSTATEIYTMIKGGKTTEVILNKFLDNYDVDKTKAKKDIDLILRELLQKKIIFEKK